MVACALTGDGMLELHLMVEQQHTAAFDVLTKRITYKSCRFFYVIVSAFLQVTRVSLNAHGLRPHASLCLRCVIVGPPPHGGSFMPFRIRFTSLFIASTLVFTACRDDASNVSPATAPDASFSKNESEAAHGVFHRYVAIGTSISMGFASEGVTATSQDNAWPLQLARRADREMSAPYIALPGCRSPFAAPLASFMRISGESVALPTPSLSCAPNLAGVTLPVANTAISGARAHNALNETPETVTDQSNGKMYPRVLPPHTTQVGAMEMQNPKFVSVEFGANEVLGARDGRVIPGVTVVPVQFFAPDYDAILDRVEATVNTGAVLVGLITDARTFPAFRAGHDLWLNRAEFLAAFHVAIQADCENSPNYIVVPFRVPSAVATGVGRRNAGLTPATFSCAAGPANVVDYVLDPGEITALNFIMAGIDAHIAAQAAARGWAYFRLDALYGRPDLKGTFSVVQMMTTATPYGPLMSLDGFHPSALGQTVLADAAASAINERYRLGLATGLANIP